MCNNPNLDLVNINTYAKFGQIPSIRSQEIERKLSRNHGMAENLKTVYPTTYFVCGGYNYPSIIIIYPLYLFHCMIGSSNIKPGMCVWINSNKLQNSFPVFQYEFSYLLLRLDDEVEKVFCIRVFPFSSLKRMNHKLQLLNWNSNTACLYRQWRRTMFYSTTIHWPEVCDAFWRRQHDITPVCNGLTSGKHRKDL